MRKIWNYFAVGKRLDCRGGIKYDASFENIKSNVYQIEVDVRGGKIW